jgi:hypothetical protein
LSVLSFVIGAFLIFFVLFLCTECGLEAENYLAQELVPTVGQGDEWFTNAATFSDLDGDGHNDLIIGNYFPDNSEILNVKATNIAPMQASMTRAYNGGTNHIFR